MARCTAKNRSGKRCGRQAAPGFKVCRSHGGHEASGRPIKHGRYSQKLLPRIAQRMDEFLRDPDLKRLDREIAVVAALAEESLDGTEAAYESLSGPIAELQDALKDKDSTPDQIRTAARNAVGAFHFGANAWQRLNVFLKHVGLLERLLKTDAWQQRAAKEGLSVSEQVSFLAMVEDALESALKKHEVKDTLAVMDTFAGNIDRTFSTRVGRPDARETRQ